MDSIPHWYDYLGALFYFVWANPIYRRARMIAGFDRGNMTMSHSVRYERGLAKFVEMYGERAKTFLASLDGIAPDLGTYVMEFAFGDIHCRPGLSLQTREIATIAALTALGTAAPQLRAHIDGALNVGCSEQEVVEVIMQMALYAGFPAAINGIQAAREVFLERSAQK